MASLGVNLNESVVELADRIAAISSNMVDVYMTRCCFFTICIFSFCSVKDVNEISWTYPFKSGIWTQI